MGGNLSRKKQPAPPTAQTAPPLIYNRDGYVPQDYSKYTRESADEVLRRLDLEEYNTAYEEDLNYAENIKTVYDLEVNVLTKIIEDAMVEANKLGEYSALATELAVFEPGSDDSKEIQLDHIRILTNKNVLLSLQAAIVMNELVGGYFDSNKAPGHNENEDAIGFMFAYMLFITMVRVAKYTLIKLVDNIQLHGEFMPVIRLLQEKINEIHSIHGRLPSFNSKKQRIYLEYYENASHGLDHNKGGIDKYTPHIDYGGSQPEEDLGDFDEHFNQIAPNNFAFSTWSKFFGKDMRAETQDKNYEYFTELFSNEKIFGTAVNNDDGPESTYFSKGDDTEMHLGTIISSIRDAIDLYLSLHQIETRQIYGMHAKITNKNYAFFKDEVLRLLAEKSDDEYLDSSQRYRNIIKQIYSSGLMSFKKTDVGDGPIVNEASKLANAYVAYEKNVSILPPSDPVYQRYESEYNFASALLEITRKLTNDKQLSVKKVKEYFEKTDSSEVYFANRLKTAVNTVLVEKYKQYGVIKSVLLKLSPSSEKPELNKILLPDTEQQEKQNERKQILNDTTKNNENNIDLLRSSVSPHVKLLFEAYDDLKKEIEQIKQVSMVIDTANMEAAASPEATLEIEDAMKARAGRNKAFKAIYGELQPKLREACDNIHANLNSAFQTRLKNIIETYNNMSRKKTESENTLESLKSLIENNTNSIKQLSADIINLKATSELKITEFRKSLIAKSNYNPTLGAPINKDELTIAYEKLTGHFPLNDQTDEQLLKQA